MKTVIPEVVKAPEVVLPEPVEYDASGKPIIPVGYVECYVQKKGLMKIRISGGK